MGVGGDRLHFDQSTPENIAFADAFANRVRSMLDEFIDRAGLPAPPAEPDAADRPIAIDPPRTLDLGAAGVGSVVWCTGYTGDFSWLGGVLLDHTGHPVHHGTAAALPGIWYIGQRWLTRRSSGNLLGFPADAATIATAVAATLCARPRSLAPMG